jgi:type III restriction enzyme
VLEPHSTSYEDSWAKAVGLAKFASRHGDLFGRIELIAKVKGKMRRLNVNDPEKRQKVLGVTGNQHLVQLFEAE